MNARRIVLALTALASVLLFAGPQAQAQGIRALSVSVGPRVTPPTPPPPPTLRIDPNVAGRVSDFSSRYSPNLSTNCPAAYRSSSGECLAFTPAGGSASLPASSSSLIDAAQRERLGRRQRMRQCRQAVVGRANYAAVVGQNPGELAPEPSLAFLMPKTADEAFSVAEENNRSLWEGRITNWSPPWMKKK